MSTFIGILCVIAYVGLSLIEKLDREEEVKQAREEGYEVWFAA